MKEHFDTSGMRDDEQHWDDLAARVAGNVVANTQRQSELLAFAGSGRAWLAAGVLVTVAAGGAFVARPSTAERLVTEFTEALEPTENIARSLTRAVEPPSVGELLLAQSTGSGGGPR